MSHEIRTPMNAVIGMSELAMREYGKPEGLGYIEEISRAGANLLAIINEILDFAKIESGSLRIASSPYDLASLLNDVITIIRFRMEEKPIEFIPEIDPSLPSVVNGDETRVRQVLLNLLSNAVKYTRKGFVKFTAAGERTGGDTIRLTFSVEDSGVGIRAEDLDKLFGDFVRIDDGSNTTIEGSGLGLLIARNLCAAMGGNIEVMSEYGRGSAFNATIFQKVVDARPMGSLWKKSAPMSRETGARFTAPGVRALIVDDIATNLMVMEGLLAPYKMNVSTCLSGKDALNLVREAPFDIVFMDYMMPGMDGAEATLAIRALDGGHFRKLPIVAVTANAVSGMREKFLANGFSDFLAKPIEISKLNDLMERWIPIDRREEIERTGNREIPPIETALKIEGLDAARGIAMTGGTLEGYVKVLKLYCRDAAERLEILRETPNEGNLALFSTQAHALKGASASIGAAEISRLAAELEDAGKRGDMKAIDGKINIFRTCLADLTARIRAALPAENTGDGRDESPVFDKSLLARLKDALIEEDIGAVDSILESFAKMPLDADAEKTLSAVSDHVLMSELKEAAETVDRLLREVCP
jgi:CheY-like chemotaxis protein